MPVFWSASTVSLAGPMVGAQIAVINSIGNLGGFVSPVAMGWLHQATHNYVAGLASVAASLGLGAFAVMRLCRPAAAAAKNVAEEQQVG
jgi:ACS family tartrate transporter-like MFS transporter